MRFIKNSSSSSSSSSSNDALLGIMLLLVMSFFHYKGAEAVIKLPGNMTVPAVFAFGDSITLVKCNFPPYGKEFKGGIPTGRFSNAKTPPDLIAEELGIKEFLPAYLDPHLEAKDLQTGVSFASGGAGFDPQTAQLASVISLSQQIEMFKKYINQLKGIVGEEKANFIIANGIHLVVAGSDDIANTYYTIGIRRAQYDINAYTDLMVSSASDFIQELYKLGCRRIAVFSVPPIGCVPSQRTLGGGPARVCAENYNQAARLANMKLSSQIDYIRQKYPQSRVTYVEIYDPLFDLIQNPQNYGFEVVDRGCCGTGDIEVVILCNKYTETCPDDTKVQALVKLPPNVTLPAVIVFGDSVVDTGNNNNLPTIAKSNYPPYGKDFMGGRPTGRFSNGKVPSDLLVEELGIKELSPAYLDVNLKPEDLLTGVNFASGAAGYDPLTSELSAVLSLSKQLELFEGYIMKLKNFAGEERSKMILSNSLYVSVTGSNDITNTYPFRQSQYDVSSYTDLMVGYGSSFIQDLYRLGARRIAILGLPPIGCLPSQRTLRGGPERNCVDNYNQMAELFDSKLEAEINSLNNKYKDSKIVYVDIFNVLLDLIHNPLNYGFKVSNIGCCGTGRIEVAELCKFPCPNVNDYVFWDSFHLTEKAYRVLVRTFVEKNVIKFL
ncbi:hypothetical protein M9H77_00187 [Catharanthus roseus]|nr:hypothetical protein M9H77_00187 [Catharanthus roseus]